jgi:tetratricopeptide (TPR) repeat protein
MKHLMCVMCLFSLFFMAQALPAADLLSQADALYAQGGSEDMLKAAAIYEQYLTSHPDDYAVNWKCARAHRDYGNTAKKQGAEGWKNTCAEYGKKAMGYAAKAVSVAPDKVEGQYYYGLSVGVYSDGVSIFTALKEGLKDKTQTSFETAYGIDKNFNEGGPILSLGRFWAVLPWPLKDKKKSLEYYREFQTTPFFADNAEAYVFLAELLLDMGGNDNTAEANQLLEKAAGSADAYYADWAKRLLKK